MLNLPRFSVKNPVTVNLIMWIIILGGIYCWNNLLREFFPYFEADHISIKVTYPGATPKEIENTVTRKIERVVKDLDVVKEIHTSIVEGLSFTDITLNDNVDKDKALNDIRNQVDQIQSKLPKEADEPDIQEVKPFIPVIVVIVHGNVSETKLRREVIKIRDELLDMPKISKVIVTGKREKEMWIEISPEKVEKFQLTFEEVGRIVAQNNFEIPGGELKDKYGNILVRTIGENKTAKPLEEIIIKGSKEGKKICLGDIAKVHETFEDRAQEGRFEGKRACSIMIFKSPE